MPTDIFMRQKPSGRLRREDLKTTTGQAAGAAFGERVLNFPSISTFRSNSQEMKRTGQIPLRGGIAGFSTGGPLSRMFREQAIEEHRAESELVTPEEAEGMFADAANMTLEQLKSSGLSTPEFERDEPLPFIQSKVAVWERKLQYQRIIESKPDTFTSSALVFGTQILADILSPVNVASAFIPVVSQARALKLTTKFGPFWGRSIVAAREGAVGSALIEPFEYASERNIGLNDYTFKDSMLNIFMGVALSVGMRQTGGMIADGLKASGALDGLTLRQEARLFDNAGNALDPRGVVDPSLIDLPADEIAKIRAHIDTVIKQNADSAHVDAEYGIGVMRHLLDGWLSGRTPDAKVYHDLLAVDAMLEAGIIDPVQAKAHVQKILEAKADKSLDFNEEWIMKGRKVQSPEDLAPEDIVFGKDGKTNAAVDASSELKKVAPEVIKDIEDLDAAVEFFNNASRAEDKARPEPEAPEAQARERAAEAEPKVKTGPKTDADLEIAWDYPPVPGPGQLFYEPEAWQRYLARERKEQGIPSIEEQERAKAGKGSETKPEAPEVPEEPPTHTVGDVVAAVQNCTPAADVSQVSPKQLTFDEYAIQKEAPVATENKVTFVDTLGFHPDKVTPRVATRIKETGEIQIVRSEVKKKFEAKAWTNPVVRKDGSFAKALPEDTFVDEEHFSAFIVKHEQEHGILFKNKRETIGAYEDRVNQSALVKVNADRAKAATPVTQNFAPVVKPKGTVKDYTGAYAKGESQASQNTKYQEIFTARAEEAAARIERGYRSIRTEHYQDVQTLYGERFDPDTAVKEDHAGRAEAAERGFKDTREFVESPVAGLTFEEQARIIQNRDDALPDVHGVDVLGRLRDELQGLSDLAEYREKYQSEPDPGIAARASERDKLFVNEIGPIYLRYLEATDTKRVFEDGSLGAAKEWTFTEADARAQMNRELRDVRFEIGLDETLSMGTGKQFRGEGMQQGELQSPELSILDNVTSEEIAYRATLGERLTAEHTVADMHYGMGVEDDLEKLRVDLFKSHLEVAEVKESFVPEVPVVETFSTDNRAWLGEIGSASTRLKASRDAGFTKIDAINAMMRDRRLARQAPRQVEKTAVRRPPNPKDRF